MNSEAQPPPDGIERRARPAYDARRALLESAVIILSILLAFGVDAWWEERREAADARESLEVVRRDLIDTLAQLEEFERYAESALADSLAAARTLMAPAPVAVEARPALEAQLVRSAGRRTMRLPRAGYTDLLNTGNLQEIDDRTLRDALVKFYEAADRSQEIIEKNSTLFTDGLLKNALYETGLLAPIPQPDFPTEIQQRSNSATLERMGSDFPVRTARLWQVPADSVELDRLIAALLQNARGNGSAIVLVQDTRAAAAALLRQVDDHLAAR